MVRDFQEGFVMSEGMIRILRGGKEMATTHGDRYVSSKKMLAHLRLREAAATKIVTEGNCGDFAQYRQNVGALMETRRTIEFVEQLVKGKEDE